MTPRHQWTDGGDFVRVVKCVNRDGTSYGGYRWPLTVGAVVDIGDRWTPDAKCNAGGFYGWPWLFSMGDGKDPQWDGTWLVLDVAPGDIVDLDGKVKFRRGTIRLVGTWESATADVLSGQMAWVVQAADGAASATGEASLAGCTGMGGRVQCGPWGVLALAWWNTQAGRSEMRCARVGVGDGSDGTLKANTWYRLDAAGDFVAETEAALRWQH